jgi:hypothetical protein
MNGTTRASADTWVKQKVLRIIGLFEADLALRFFLSFWRFIILESFLGSGIVFHDIATRIYPGPVFGAGSADFSVDTCLADKEFDSAELNDLAWLEFIA